jgi:ElaA protein
MPDFVLKWQRFTGFSTERLYELLRFRQAIFVVEQCSPYPDLDGFDQEAWHLLLRQDGRLGGCLRVRPPPDLRIGRVAVAADLRRQGLARRLMTEALGLCRERWPGRTIHLTAQLPLARFYESFGFSPISEPYEDFGLTHQQMRLQLR